jgi:hypothetical protein
MAAYELRDRRPEANDPTLRAARLEVAHAYAGLGPGVWIAGADDLDDELRAMTMRSRGWRDWWHTAIAAHVSTPDIDLTTHVGSPTGSSAEAGMERLVDR